MAVMVIKTAISRLAKPSKTKRNKGNPRSCAGIVHTKFHVSQSNPINTSTEITASPHAANRTNQERCRTVVTTFVLHLPKRVYETEAPLRPCRMSPRILPGIRTRQSCFAWSQRTCTKDHS